MGSSARKAGEETGQRITGRTLHRRDEPTTGLNLGDTACVPGMLQRLVSAGTIVIAVEHNLEIRQSADRVIILTR